MGQISRFKDSLFVSQSISGDYGGGAYQSGFPDFDQYWSSGTGSSQADLFWEDIGVTLATATTRNLDLRALTSGPGGSTVDMREIRYFAMRCRDFALLIAKGAANGFTGFGSAFSLVIPAGMWFRLVDPTDGKVPTGAADKVLDITNSSGSTATYDLLIVGTSV